MVNLKIKLIKTYCYGNENSTATLIDFGGFKIDKSDGKVYDIVLGPAYKNNPTISPPKFSLIDCSVTTASHNIFFHDIYGNSISVSLMCMTCSKYLLISTLKNKIEVNNNFVNIRLFILDHFCLNQTEDNI